MSQRIREINQQYWRHESLPYIELRSTYQSVQGYKAHSHSELSIGAVISGQTRLSFGGQDQLLEEGDLIVIEPGKVHACNPVEGYLRSYHMLYVDSLWCLNKLSTLYSSPVKKLVCDQVLIQQSNLYGLFTALVEQLKSGHFADANLTFDQLAFHVLAECCSPDKDGAENKGLCYRIKRRLLEDLVQPPTLDSLAEEFSRSKETIIRTFSKNFGITPKSFINNARIEKAKLSLREGKNIVDVSTEVGFSDQSQFHRAFVTYTASTPRQYQQAQSIFDNNS